MKKIALLSLLVLGLGFTACDNYEEPNPPAQYNPQESVLKTDEVTVSNLLTSDVYDLEALNEEDQMIEAAQISCDKLPQGYTFGAYVFLFNQELGGQAQLDAQVVAGEEENTWTIEIDPQALQNAFYDNIAKTGNETALEVRYILTTVNGSQVAIVGGPANYYGPFDMTIKPFPMVGPEQLYTPGDANGWSQTASLKLITDNFTTYFGYAVLSPGGFKFSSQADWNGINYGASTEEGVLDTDPGAGNLVVPTLGLYWCNVNISSLTYTADYVSTYGVIGDSTPGGWDASTALTPSDDFTVWTGEITFGAGKFKFRANNAWDINLGGSYDNLTQDGADLDSPGEGTYTVTLNLGTVPYSCTLTKK